MNPFHFLRTLIVSIACTSCFFFTSSAGAAENGLALGVVVGDPTGLSFRQNLSNQNFVDAAMAWSYRGVQVHGNYLLNRPNKFSIDKQNLDLYYGIGARLISISDGKNKNKIAIAPRAPVGVTLITQDPNLQIFAEAAVNLDLIPESSIDLDAGLGIRYRF